MPSEKPTTVIAAMIANLVIAAAKFVAAVVTGSSAMLSEGIHSVVDTGNQGLLLFGVKRSAAEPDVEHPFGYGKELYFWALIVAVLLFGAGGGMSLYEGIHHLASGSEKGRSFAWAYGVLLIALIAESISLLIAVRAIQRREIGNSFWEKFHNSKDPTRYVVVVEDCAAVMGIVIALLGLLLQQITGSPIPDGVASLLIGVILATVAIYLALQSRDLLIGQSTDPEVVAHLLEIAERHPAVLQARKPLTMHFGPEQVLLTLDIQFAPDLGAAELARAIDEIETGIREPYPQVRWIYIEAQLWSTRGASSTAAPRR